MWGFFFSVSECFPYTPKPQTIAHDVSRWSLYWKPKWVNSPNALANWTTGVHHRYLSHDVLSFDTPLINSVIMPTDVYDFVIYCEEGSFAPWVLFCAKPISPFLAYASMKQVVPVHTHLYHWSSESWGR